MLKTLVLIFLLVGSAIGQGGLQLFTFSQIKEALIRGNELQVNADASACTTTGLTNMNVLFSIPLRHWQVEIYKTGAEEIRADDFYIDTFDPTVATVFTRGLNIFDDNTLRLTLSTTTFGTNVTDVITLDCEIGVGAVFHPMISGEDIVEIDSYAYLRSFLLQGDHVEAVLYLTDCLNGGDVFLDGDQYISGFQIQRFDVIREAEPGEVILIDDVSVYTGDGSVGQLVASNDRLIIARDGTVAFSTAIWNPTVTEELFSFSLTCALGTSVKFTKHQRENEMTWSTYEAIKDATIAGHDMELVAFVEYCDILNGPSFEQTGLIISARTDEFQLFKAGELWGDLEHLAYSAWTIGSDADLHVDVARLYEDGNMTIEYLNDGRISGEKTHGTISCPLRTATVFHSVGRNRFPMTNYDDILGEIVRTGQTYEIEVDYNLCQGAAASFDSIFGGIAWQTYIDTNPDTGFFFADVFNLVEQRLTDPNDPQPAWNAAGIIMRPNGTVTIEARLYDFDSGANLVTNTENIECTLGAGVTFFPYP